MLDYSDDRDRVPMGLFEPCFLGESEKQRISQTGEKEMRDLRHLSIKFDLDISDKQLELYFDDDDDPSYLKDCLREELAKLHPDFWVKEVMIDVASHGLYKIDVLLFAEMPDEDSSKVSISVIKKKVTKAIVDVDHAISDLKVVIN